MPGGEAPAGDALVGVIAPEEPRPCVEGGRPPLLRDLRLHGRPSGLGDVNEDVVVL